MSNLHEQDVYPLFALVGPSASGKSTVAKELRDSGVVHVDSDEITRRIQSGDKVIDAMKAILGVGIVTDDGKFDRNAARDIVFRDAEKRHLLQELIWPQVIVEMENRIAATSPEDIVVADITAFNGQTHIGRFAISHLIIVEASPDITKSRLVERGLSEQQADDQLSAQLSNEQILELVHNYVGYFVLSNRNSHAEFVAQIPKLLHDMREAKKLGGVAL